LDKKTLVEKFYSHVSEELLESFILTLYGPEAELVAKDYAVSDEILEKYEWMLANTDLLAGKVVADLGCNHGLWMLVSLMMGAKKVIGIEPRGMYCDGFNAFCKKHGLNGSMFQGTDLDFENKTKNLHVDTLLLFGVVDVVFDLEKLFYTIGEHTKIKNIVCIMTNITTGDIDFTKFPIINPTNVMGITIHVDAYNADVRSPMNKFHPVANEKTGLQTTLDSNFDLATSLTTRNVPSVEYISALAKRYNFSVTQNKVISEEIKWGPRDHKPGDVRFLTFTRSEKG